jgi:hypothetical protein
MSSFDQFLEQKQNGFMASMTAMKSLEVHVLNTTCETEAGHTEELKRDLFDFFKVISKHFDYKVRIITYDCRCLSGETNVICH